MNKIRFHSNRRYNDYSENFNPIPTKNNIPNWYLSAKKYEIDEKSGDNLLNYDGGKLPSFKACPALLDIFTSGYLYVTPCDLKFSLKDGVPFVETQKGFEDFCSERPEMKEFKEPYGHHKKHFHWYPNWAPSLPEGYSALYISPLNRFDLPFTTVAGIIDNDRMDTPGLMPFFLKKDFEGIIPAGTPYIQIIPFKREDWQMEIKKYNTQEIYERHIFQSNKYRVKNGGAYKKNTWSKKKYL